MQEQSFVETIRVQGGQLIDKVGQLIHEGNVRRIRVKQGDQTIVELPLTIGIVGAVLAPMLAAVGAIAALITDCTIEVERVGPSSAASNEAPIVVPPDEPASTSSEVS